jgi:glycosyltransferase involved in cell wall biosynthesis
MIKLSIITPTFNNASVLKENINSVLAQSFKDVEHIIIDSLSNDGTDKLVDDYKKIANYPVIYVREKDNGLYEAINKGIKIARSEWIHILNSDDYYYSNESIKELFKSDIQSFDVITCSIVIKNEKNDKLNSIWVPEYNVKINHYNFPHPGIVIKKSFYDLNGYYNEKFKIISDAIFVMENMSKAKYKIIDSPLVVMAESGISNKLSWTKTYEGIIFNIKYYKGSRKNKIKFIMMDLKRDFRIFLVKMMKKKYCKKN